MGTIEIVGAAMGLGFLSGFPSLCHGSSIRAHDHLRRGTGLDDRRGGVAPHLGIDGGQRSVGIRVAATKGIKGMANSIGFLTAGQAELVFATRRGLRPRTHRIRFNEIESAEWKRGILMHRLTLHTRNGEQSFFIKGIDIRAVSAAGSSFASTGAYKDSPAVHYSAAPPPPVIEPLLGISCVHGPAKGCTFAVPADGILIGRDPQRAHLIVETLEVSSCHARITLDRQQAAVWIEDLGSTNGTFYCTGRGSWLPVRGRHRLTCGNRFRLSGDGVEFEVTAG